MQIAQYIKAQTVEEAWQLNQKKTAAVLGGGCWLRLSPRRHIQSAIDLSGLGLDKIEDTENEFKLGAMVTLRDMEQCMALETYSNGTVKEALRHIVGVQFRNMATVGGSLCGRFGFSDVLTLLLALDARVVLYKGGRMKLADFARLGAGRDILTHVLIPRQQRRTAYGTLRLNATDFPLITCAVSVTDKHVCCSIGARPKRAELQTLTKEEVQRAGILVTARKLADAMDYESNMRSSAEYRHDMAVVLCRRLLTQTMGVGES